MLNTYAGHAKVREKTGLGLEALRKMDQGEGLEDLDVGSDVDVETVIEAGLRPKTSNGKMVERRFKGLELKKQIKHGVKKQEYLTPGGWKKLKMDDIHGVDRQCCWVESFCGAHQ